MTGGGQPIQPAEVRNNIDLKAERAKALYNADKKAPLRKSHDNPEVKELYADFLGEPNGHLARDILSTLATCGIVSITGSSSKDL